MSAPQSPPAFASMAGGFTDLPRQSAQAFRALMDAMARPGRIHEVSGGEGPAPLSVAAAVTLLTLADDTTSLHLAGGWDCAPIRDWVAFHCGAPLTGPEGALLALGDWASLQPVARFSPGLPDYPDRAATLIVEMPALSPEGARLTGPGIRDEARLSLPETAAFQQNRRFFPLGLDVILTCGSRLAAVPRSTRVEEA